MSRKKRKAVNVRKNSEKAKFSTCLFKNCSVLFREAVKKKTDQKDQGAYNFVTWSLVML